MTYAIAMAAGRDAANARMHNAGRTRWNQGDYNASVRLFNQLWPAHRDIHDGVPPVARPAKKVKHG